MSGKLYVVGTPIGNLSDFSPRAIETLENADFIAAEDTRVTVKLLNHFMIKKPLISYFEHNKYQKGEIICNRIEQGETCALVSDAGMPAISDPGEMLVKQCAERGIEVLVVPGPSAVVSAIAVSGLPTGRFTFEGFLSTSKKSRREHLLEVKDEPRTMVFYEAPHKLKTTLSDMLEAWGDRKISLVREITKIHEETMRTTLSKALEYYTGNTPKGEFVIVIEGIEKKEDDVMTSEQAVEYAKRLMQEGFSAAQAAKTAAQAANLKKSDLYRKLNE